MSAIRTLSRYLRPYRHWAVLAPLAMTLEVAMDLMQPRLVERIVDQGIVHTNMAVVLHTGLWMIACAVVGMVGGMGCTVFSVLAAQGLGCDIRKAAFAKVQSFSFGNLDRLETGALITRLTNDVNQVQDAFMMGLRVMVRVPLLLVGSVVMGILTSPKLSLLFLVLIPVVLVVLSWIIRRTYPIFAEVQRRLDALNTVMQENLAGVRVVKAFARSAFEMLRFRKIGDALMDQNIVAARFGALTMPIVMLILNTGLVAVIWLGGIQFAAGKLQVGQIVAFSNYLLQTLMALMMVSMLIVRMSRAEASAQRIQEVMLAEPEVKPASNPATHAPATGRVVFENVTFSYSGDGNEPVLREISFVAEPGQTLAILGATGSGKSSLINLIPRFYDVTTGRITIDGVDIRTLDEQTLHRMTGVVLQESILFSGTIRDNIRYGRPEADDAAVTAAAQAAQAHDFILHLEGGYDARVGQRGLNLSGGQRQRIAIARALLPNPTILIFDDSTSAVDVQTESRIYRALAGQKQTRIVVAQRISTVLNADKILVLDAGRIAAQGAHEQLLASSPIYREIYESQTNSGGMAHASSH